MGFERVRRLNEPREETALCELRECAFCLQQIEGGGLSLGTRWLHLNCIEAYIESLELQRDRAVADNMALRASASAGGVTWIASPGMITISTTAAQPTGYWYSATSAQSFVPYSVDINVSSTSGLEKSLGP